MDAVQQGFFRKVEFDPNSGCWLWTGRVNDDGYGRVRLPRSTGAHRLSYEWAHGEVPAGMVVMHKCDTPACVNPDHLRAGTQLDNIADRKAKGRSRGGDRRGEKNRAAKITAADALTIRQLISAGASQTAVAALYPISRSQVGRIANGLKWPTSGE